MSSDQDMTLQPHLDVPPVLHPCPSTQELDPVSEAKVVAVAFASSGRGPFPVELHHPPHCLPHLSRRARDAESHLVSLPLDETGIVLHVVAHALVEALHEGRPTVWQAPE